MPHRILFVINGTDFGGTESALSTMAYRLHQRGHDVHVLSLKPVGRTGRVLTDSGISVTSLEMPEVAGYTAVASGCWRLAKRLRQHRPEIVHSFLPRANIVSCLALKIARLKALHISNERSTDLHRRNTVTRLNRFTARWIDHVLAVSTEVRDVLVERERIAAHKISVLGNGIDPDQVDAQPAPRVRETLSLDPEGFTLCSAGRLVPDKGHVYLIRAIARMRAAARANLLLVGEGPEEARLRAEAAAEGLSNRVHFLGYRPDLLGILKTVDIFVLPSLEEGIPIVLLEAMACARPVVATDVGGIHTLILPGETGVLVPPAEIWTRRAGAPNGTGPVDPQTAMSGVAALAEAIDRLVASPSAAAEMGQRARQYIGEQFALDRIVTRLEHLYDALGPGTCQGVVASRLADISVRAVPPRGRSS